MNPYILRVTSGPDRWLAQGWPRWVAFTDVSGGPLSGNADFVYMSWTNLTTLGSSFNPNGVGAQALPLTEVTCGLLLLTVILAVVLGLVRPVARQ